MTLHTLPRAARIDEAVKAVLGRFPTSILERRWLLNLWLEEADEFCPVFSIKHAFRVRSASLHPVFAITANPETRAS